MFDGIISRSERFPQHHAPAGEGPMPWQFVAFLVVMAALTAVLAALYPALLAPFEQF